MKRKLAALALLALLPLSACAHSESLLDMRVIDLDSSTTLEPVEHAGRDYVAGQPGHRFAVALHNRTGQRVLAVLSVDGVNAISGQTAGTGQGGYVLEPWQEVEIHGWRKSYSDVAEFYFTDLPDSYAGLTGRPDNVGVIGVAAFRERQRAPIAYQPAITDSVAKSSAARDSGALSRLGEASAPMAEPQQLGTGHGERRYDPVSQTEFERDSARPNQTLALFYDSVESLAQRGIFPAHRAEPAPQPFPIGFVPDPWR